MNINNHIPDHDAQLDAPYQQEMDRREDDGEFDDEEACADDPCFDDGCGDY